VQATVHTFDPATGAGSMLTDDGTRLVFAPAAFEGSGLRLLRPGQRLTVEVRDDEVVGMRLLGV
jgi:2-phospho-L-lactate/phosphoenolpyruvate guanylyltransferase